LLQLKVQKLSLKKQPKAFRGMQTSKNRGLTEPVVYKAGDALVTVTPTILWMSEDVDDVTSSLRLQHGVMVLVLQDFDSGSSRHNPHVKVLTESQIGWIYIGDLHRLCNSANCARNEVM